MDGCNLAGYFGTLPRPTISIKKVPENFVPLEMHGYLRTLSITNNLDLGIILQGDAGVQLE